MRIRNTATGGIFNSSLSILNSGDLDGRRSFYKKAQHNAGLTIIHSDDKWKAVLALDEEVERLQTASPESDMSSR
ncbi:hypothetical protein CRN59_02015 [Vibrio vulnificus]|nr:hypothetical protein CRN59_02015 [Vibrio vulnificus]